MTHAADHDAYIALLSIGVAMVASYAALDVAGRARAASAGQRLAWRGAAALAMSVGIWSMHFIAMLGVQTRMPVTYDPMLTAASFGLAVFATGLAFEISGRGRAGAGRLAAGGLFMGIGIAGMHYVGMAALTMPATLSYDPGLVSVSVLIAVAASTVALWLALRETETGKKALAAGAMGLAISGMHYVSMAAATVTPLQTVSPEPVPANLDASELAAGVAASTFLILVIALVASAVDRRMGRSMEREAERLRLSEEHIRTIYCKTPLPLHTLDRDGRIHLVSEAWLDLLGLGRDQVVGRFLTDFMLTDSAERYRAGASRAGEPHRVRGEFTFVRRDGQLLDICLDETATEGFGGQAITLGGLTDLTDRKKAEASLRQAQKLETLGQLTGGLAHDFNNLLSVIAGNMGLLAKRVAGDPRAARMVESATQAADRGAALTQRMLAFARRQDLKPQPNDVRDLVYGMADLLRRSIGPSIRLDLRFPASLPPALVDRNQLEMAIVNLAVNARDAMPKGGTIVLEAAEASAGDADDIKAGHYVRLTVSDTGEGMDEATLTRAADPFFTTKGIGKGTGLGLSMVQGLAAQSGGRLVLKSRPGDGTVAELWLPAGQAMSVRCGAETLPADDFGVRNASALTVLVVDDDPLVLMGTAAMLEDLGHTVIEAGSGRQALALLEDGGRPDVLVTDYAMPRMTGGELIARIRTVPCDLPVVLATGYADLTDAHLDDVIRLAKPFTQEALGRAVQAAVERTKLQPV